MFEILHHRMEGVCHLLVVRTQQGDLLLRLRLLEVVDGVLVPAGTSAKRPVVRVLLECNNVSGSSLDGI